MSETAFKSFYILLRIGTPLIYAACLLFFVKPFLTEKEHVCRKLFLVFFIHLAAWLLCCPTPIPRGTFSLILPALFLTFSKKLNIEKAFSFMLSLFYCNVRILSGLLIESLDFIADKILPLKSGYLHTIYLHSAAQTLLFLLFHLFVLATMLYTFQRQIIKRPLTLQWQELSYMSLIPATGILFGQIVSGLLFEINDGTPLLLYERHPAFLGLIPLLALLFYTGSLLTITFWQKADILRREREEYFVSLQQIRTIQNRIHESELIYTRFQGMKHEMRGHLNNIMGLSQNRQYKDLERYIARMDESMHSFELTLQTGNAVTDVIVNDIRQHCLEKGIDLNMNFHYPVSGQYDAFSLGIILQNLLQNALEACEKAEDKKQYIFLASRQKGNFFLIKVKNSFSGKIKFTQDGLPETTRTESGTLHGIGLSNVRREAEKYMGELELTIENQEFCATVLLQERSKQ